MSPSENDGPMTAGEDALLRRVVSILEQARQNVVRSVNSNMVVAYWLIGREIVEGVQEGEERAEYGKKVPTASPDAWRNATVRVTAEYARSFYEKEAIECGWSKAQLERQIQSSFYERILANRGPEGLISRQRERLPGEPVSPREILRSPLVLEFLDTLTPRCGPDGRLRSPV